MKYKGQEYIFETDKINKIWIALNSQSALNDNKKISVCVKQNNKKISREFPAKNRIICSLERIEDGLEYLNSYELIPSYKERNAFGFMEFLNCEYVIVHCIKDLGNIFGLKPDDNTNEDKCFSDFSYGNSNDSEVFEYVRSLCAVHPTDTSMHPSVHGEGEFHCCSRVVWDSDSGTDQRDLTVVIYSSEDEGETQYIGIKIESFVVYLNKWINFLDEIERAIYSFIEEDKKRLREKHILLPEEFENYIEYIDNLHREYELRVDDSGCHADYFDYYKLAFLIDFDDEEIQKKNECYKAAIKYMFSFLHKQMQVMDERQFTGIRDLSDNDRTNLFYELYLPIEGSSKFSNDRGAFSYVYHLNSIVSYDVFYAREVLSKIASLVNQYVKFENTESMDETHLLLQIATYFDALKQNGYINKSIPDKIEFRGEYSSGVLPGEESIAEYVLNINTKWIHLPTCSSVRSTKEQNRKVSKASIGELKEQGYVPCGNCLAEYRE